MNIFALAAYERAWRALRGACELLCAPHKWSSCSQHQAKSKRQLWRAVFCFLVEVWRFELQASSTRTRKNMFFEHFYLHIVRIFREIVSFCTFVPFIPYRTFPVVVSYVVKLKIRWKAENGESDNVFSPPLTNRTRVKKYARNIRSVWCIVTLKRRKIKSFWW